MKTSELTGAQLDYWVAKAQGYAASLHQGVLRISRQGGLDLAELGYAPSTDWAQGGPLIERERITVQASQAGDWRAFLGDGTTNAGTGRAHTDPMIQTRGAAPLIAAMRCLVASKYGDEVPDEI